MTEAIRTHGYGQYMAWEQQQLQSDWFRKLTDRAWPNHSVEICDDPEMQKAGVDLLVHRPEHMVNEIPPWDRQARKVDCKFRRTNIEQDFLVEIRHIGPTVDMEGWGLRGLGVHYLMYVSTQTQSARLMDWVQWWRWWLANRNELSKSFPLSQAKNRTYVTYFVCLPWSLFDSQVDVRVIE